MVIPYPARAAVTIAVAAMLGGSLLAAGPAPGSVAGTACQPWTGVEPPDPGGSEFSSLAASDVISPCRAWAVGDYASGSTLASLIVRWNGRAWTQVSSPNPGAPTEANLLHGVAATSPRDAWAVGDTSIMAFARTLIVRWNGTAWHRVTSPNGPGVTEILQGVAATAPSNAWAVGFDSKNGAFERALILHWNGRRWAIRSDSVTGDLQAVAARSARDAWAVGFVQAKTGTRTLILHWNGKLWRKVPSPSPGPGSILLGVAAVSPTDAWAVGDSQLGSGSVTLIVHWNGRHWQKVSSPNRFGSTAGSGLSGVAATSSRAAWAVGVARGGSVDRTLVVHWNGRSWRRVPSPNPDSAGDDDLFGVGASSAGNVWMVGMSTSQDGHTSKTIALHCC
jgi:hypothetical protein